MPRKKTDRRIKECFSKHKKTQRPLVEAPPPSGAWALRGVKPGVVRVSVRKSMGYYGSARTRTRNRTRHFKTRLRVRVRHTTHHSLLPLQYAVRFTELRRIESFRKPCHNLLQAGAGFFVFFTVLQE